MGLCLIRSLRHPACASLLDLGWTYRTEGAYTMRAKLTERLIKDLHPQAAPYEVVDMELHGLILRVQPSGVLTYYLVYRTMQGTKKRYRLGRQGL